MALPVHRAAWSAGGDLPAAQRDGIPVRGVDPGQLSWRHPAKGKPDG